MASSGHQQTCSGISFDVELERPVTPRSSGPKRLQHHGKPKPLTPEELEEKQRKAEERRKAYEAARLERIHARQEQCRQLNENVSVLLAQDAKRRGVEGLESVRPMSSAKAAATVQTVARGLGKMGLQLDADLETPK